MEKELNIAAILKDKPKGTKLWSDTFGKAELWRVSEDNYPIKIALLNGNVIDLTKEGKYFEDIEDCQYCIFPSKSMRDWSKFAWKKGDVLQYNDDDMGVFLVFDRWKDDTYEHFIGKFEINHPSMCDEITSSREMSEGITNECHLIGEGPLKEEYLADVEKAFGGKLNLDTLKIEKPQFKDGDIVTIHKKECDITFIFNRMKTKDSFYYYAFHTYNENNTGIIDERISLPYEWTYIDGKISPATDSEKKQLFAALEKEGKAWDTEKKAIVDLPKMYKFKTMDYFLARYNYSKDALWNLYQYAYTDKDGYIFVVNESCIESDKYTCIPYNEQTAHLLGTSDDWKGGER